MCPHCKIDVIHAPYLWFDLKKNAAIRPRGWKSQLWQQGTSKIVDKVNEWSNYPSSALISSNRCSPPPPLIRSITITNTHLEILDLGTRGYFFTKDSPKKNVDHPAPLIRVDTASGQPMTSTSTRDIAISQLPSEFPTTGHVMPVYHENLVGVGPMYDANFTVTFTKHTVNIYSPTGTPIITGWRETTGTRLCCMSIMPNPVNMTPLPDNHKTTTLQDFSAYDLPSVEALIWYFHAATGFPVRDTWLKAITAGNLVLWPGLTYHNVAKACPTTHDTLKGYMVQVHQGILSTKPNPTRTKCKKSEADILPRDKIPS